jgi:hypothetical protein
VTLVIWKLLFFLPPLMVPGTQDWAGVGEGLGSWKGLRHPWNREATWRGHQGPWQRLDLTWQEGFEGTRGVWLVTEQGMGGGRMGGQGQVFPAAVAAEIQS